MQLEIRFIVAFAVAVLFLLLYGKGLKEQAYSRYRTKGYILYLVLCDLLALYLLLRLLGVLI